VDEHAAPPKKKRGGRRPPQREPQGEGYRLRLRYEKLGRAAFGSHLDLVRLLPRLFRRLGLRLRHSEGFRPRPKLSFGPALPLGVLSVSEYVDVSLLGEAPSDLAALPEALSQTCVDGIRFVEAALLLPGDTKLGALIDEAVYVAALPRAALHEIGLADEGALARLFAERQQGELHVRRNVDGIGRAIDVGSKLLGAEVGRGADTLAAAGLLGDFVPVHLRVRCDGDGSCKPSEAITALTGHDDLPVRYVREALLSTRHAARVAPLELQTLRATRKPRDERAAVSP
jgi:radical SAM-linked protein